MKIVIFVYFCIELYDYSFSEFYFEFFFNLNINFILFIIYRKNY